jgi:hypothetical protein
MCQQLRGITIAGKDENLSTRVEEEAEHMPEGDLPLLLAHQTHP